MGVRSANEEAEGGRQARVTICDRTHEGGASGPRIHHTLHRKVSERTALQGAGCGGGGEGRDGLHASEAP